MNIDRIEHKIERAIEHERATNDVRTGVRQFVAMIGRPVTSQQEDEAVQFITEYVRHVPLLLREGKREAQRRNIAGLDQVLSAASWYWELESDVIPDHLGLLGVTDDAYCSLSLLQRVSQRCRDESGTPLLADDLTPANLSMRALIGEPFATQLDGFVEEKLGTAAPANAFAAIMRAIAQLGPVMMRDHDPIWGDASIKDIVDVRMGAMGIV